MLKNLDSADLLTKLTLSVLTILSYFLNMMSGPFAEILMVLSFIVLIISVVKLTGRSRS